MYLPNILIYFVEEPFWEIQLVLTINRQTDEYFVQLAPFIL